MQALKAAKVSSKLNLCLQNRIKYRLRANLYLCSCHQQKGFSFTLFRQKLLGVNKFKTTWSLSKKTKEEDQVWHIKCKLPIFESCVPIKTFSSYTIYSPISFWVIISFINSRFISDQVQVLQIIKQMSIYRKKAKQSVALENFMKTKIFWISHRIKRIQILSP